MPRPVRMSPLPTRFRRRPWLPAVGFGGGLEHRQRARAPESCVVARARPDHLQPEFQRIGFRRRRRFVDERFGGERRLRAVRIAQVAGAERRLPDDRQAHDLARHLAIRNHVHVGRHGRRCRRPVSPAAIPSAVRSARYPARCSRGGCSRTSAPCSRRPSAARALSRAPRIFTRNAGLLVSHAVSSSLIHCMRTGRPISRAIHAASQPASSAAVRPNPCGPCIQITRTCSGGMPRNVAIPRPHPVRFHVVRIDGHLAVRGIGRRMGAAERGVALEWDVVFRFDRLCRAGECRIRIAADGSGTAFAIRHRRVRRRGCRRVRM